MARFGRARIKTSTPENRTMDGITFASKAEMLRYFELKLMERSGIISQLELQPEYVLQEAFAYRGERFRSITYRADFRYHDNTTHRNVVEDVKGMYTEVYKLKKKLLLKRYPDINFVEVKR
jgi:hypothetical protein